MTSEDDEFESWVKTNDPTLYLILKSQNIEDTSENYQQFITNVMRGYSFLLTGPYIEPIPVNEDTGVPSFFESTPELDRIYQKFFSDLQELGETLDPDDFGLDFFSSLSPLLKMGLGYAGLSDKHFLLHQSIITLAISLEAYLKDSIAKVLISNYSLLDNFNKEINNLSPNSHQRVYKLEIDPITELVDWIRPRAIDGALRNIGYDNFLPKLKGNKYDVSSDIYQFYNRLFIYRDSIVHNNGRYTPKCSKEAKIFQVNIKCESGRAIYINKRIVQKLYRIILSSVNTFDDWVKDMIIVNKVGYLFYDDDDDA